MTPPALSNCPNCEQPIHDGDLELCPNCGELLDRGQKLPIANIIGAVIVSLVSLPMGACSIYFVILPGGSYEVPASDIRWIATIPLLLGAFGVAYSIQLLRNK